MHGKSTDYAALVKLVCGVELLWVCGRAIAGCLLEGSEEVMCPVRWRTTGDTGLLAREEKISSINRMMEKPCL